MVGSAPFPFEDPCHRYRCTGLGVICGWNYSLRSSFDEYGSKPVNVQQPGIFYDIVELESRFRIVP